MAARILTALLLAGPALALAGEEQRVPLSVTEPVGAARSCSPVTAGVPVGPLGVKNVSELVLTGADGTAMPAQILPTVRHQDGRLLWVLVDFLADLDAGATAKYSLGRRAAGAAAPPAVEKPVTVGQDQDGLALANGIVRVLISKKRFDLFDMVWADRDGDGKFTDAERMLSAERPAALKLVRAGNGAAFEARSGRVDRVELEDPGPVRSTVRVDGSFAAAGGDESWLEYTARLTMWAGRPEVRVLLAIRNVNAKAVSHAHIKKASVALKLAAPTGKHAHYLLGAGGVRMSQISAGPEGVYKGSQWHSRVELRQVGPPAAVCGKSHRRFYKLVNFTDAGYRVLQHQPRDRKPITDIGFACDGWVDLAGDGGGCLVWLRNFTHDCPKRLLAGADGLVEVELLPEHAGKDQPYYGDGGYWLADRSHRSYEMSFRFHPRPLAGEADWELYRGSYNNYIEPSRETAGRAAATVADARHRLQMVSTPEWYTRTGALWGVMPTLAEEDRAARSMGWTKPGPVSFYHVGQLAKDFLAYENFHYRSEWDEPRDCLVEFLRTGDWDTFTRGHAFARNYRDLGVWRTDGKTLGERAAWSGPKKGPWATPRWGKFCGCHHYGAGLIDYWLLTGDRSYLEAGLEWSRQCAVPGGYGGFGYRHWGRRMAAALRAYQVTRDPALCKFLVKHCRPPTPTEAQRVDGRALLAGHKMASWMVGLCTHAVWHNYVENRDAYSGTDLDDFEDGIVGMARQVANYWWNQGTRSGPYHFLIDGAGPGKVKFTGGSPAYSLTCIDTMTRGYLLTGDRYLLEAARKYWQNVNGEEADVQHARLQDFSSGSGSFWARQLVYELANPRADAEPPAAITDLRAEALGGGKVRLTWTAPREDSGRAARYQLKHAPATFCVMRDYRFPEDRGKKWTWWAGYNVADEPAPAEAGTEQSMTVEGVPAGKRFFCLRSRDASNNESALGSVVEVDVK